MNIKDNRGITLIALIVTIVILLILTGVTITAGTESIKKAKLETLRTNMLLISAKGKEYCEEANFRAGTNNEVDKGTEYLLNDKQLKQVSSIPNSSETYDFIAELDETELKRIGLNEVANSKDIGTFYIGFKIIDNKVEVYNSKGFSTKNGTKYSLTQIEAIED